MFASQANGEGQNVLDATEKSVRYKTRLISMAGAAWIAFIVAHLWVIIDPFQCGHCD